MPEENRLTASERFGLAALKGYRRAKRTTRTAPKAHPDDQAAEVGDLITDLLHYAAGQGYDTAMIVRIGQGNYEAESANAAIARRQGLTGAAFDAVVNS